MTSEMRHDEATARNAAATPLIAEDSLHRQFHHSHPRSTSRHLRGVHLAEGEAVVSMVRPKWTVVLPAFAVVVGVVALVVIQRSLMNGIFDALVWPAVAISVALVLVAIISWRHDVVLLTTERLIHLRGTLSQQVREIPLSDISDTSVKQEFVERMIDAGSLQIDVSSGETEILAHISDPTSFQEQLVEEAERNTRSLYSTQVTSEKPSDHLTELKRLYVLYQTGAIDDVEYREAKSRILRRL